MNAYFISIAPYALHPCCTQYGGLWHGRPQHASPGELPAHARTTPMHTASCSRCTMHTHTCCNTHTYEARPKQERMPCQDAPQPRAHTPAPTAALLRRSHHAAGAQILCARLFRPGVRMCSSPSPHSVRTRGLPLLARRHLFCHRHAYGQTRSRRPRAASRSLPSR